MSKPDLSTYGGRLRDVGYAGGLVDQNISVIETKINEGATAVDFGYGVARGAADNTCKVPGNSDKIIGIAVRHGIQVANSSGDVNYAQRAAVPVLRNGYVYAIPHENVTRGDSVVALVAQSGKLGTAASNPTPTAASAAKAGGNTGNGTLTLDATTPVLAGAVPGVYTVRCIAAATNGGTFRVEDPDGHVIGDVAVGATFTDDIKFVITDGSTDFIVGDGFDITVTAAAGRLAVPNAAWETTTTAGSVGIVRIAG